MEVQNDEDDDDNDNMLQRSPSPTPLSPPPSTEEFLELSIREQFVYTKSILKAILMHEYEPVHDKHRQFMNGGKQRESVVAQGGLRGNMDPKHVELLQTYIEEWCLREELRVVKGIEDSVHVDEVPVGDVRVPDGTEEDLGLQAMERPASPLLAADVDASVQRPISPSMTEAMTASSPPAIPPSSSLPSSSKIDREGSVLSNTPSLPSVGLNKSLSRSPPSDHYFSLRSHLCLKLRPILPQQQRYDNKIWTSASGITSKPSSC